jgi:hypothetical protein
MRTGIKGHTAALAVALIAVAGAAGALESKDTEHRSFDLARSAGARTVIVDNVFGSVRVHAGAGDRVEVVIEKTIRGSDAAAIARARQEVTLGVTEKPGRLELVQEGPFRDRGPGGRDAHWRELGYEVDWSWDVTMPADAAVEASTVNGEALEIDGVRGEVSASSVNGNVRLSDVGGRATATTVNGDVAATFTVPLASPARFETINGEIDLAFPKGFGAELAFSTLHGEVYTDFPSTLAAQPARVEAETHGSAHRFRIGRDSVVRLGEGGPRLECSTINGDIVIRER